MNGLEVNSKTSGSHTATSKPSTLMTQPLDSIK